MASTLNLDAYSDALVVLGTAGILIPVVSRFGVSAIVGYIAAGAILGSSGLGQFRSQFPLLHWVTITDEKSIGAIAEFGVIFLLFLIGLEMTFERLKSMRRAIVGLGGTQWLASSVLIAGAAVQFGHDVAASMVMGACLALSSTAIVIEILASQNRLSRTVGRASFAILLAQDIMIIPILIFIAILGTGVEGSILQTMSLALLQAALAIGFIVLVGRTLLRPLFRLVAGTQSNELFIAAILFVIVATGVIAALAGLSMALGAFVAGLLLAETEYRKSIEAIVNPFKGLLLGIFFFTVGMAIDMRVVWAEPARMLGTIVALLTVKAIIVLAIARVARLSWPVSIEASLLLAPGGELAFVGISAALVAKVIEPSVGAFAMVVISLSMALTPFLAIGAQRIIALLSRKQPIASELLVRPTHETGHVIVVGYGRVGRVVCDMLARHAVPFIATDFDARSVAEDRKRGDKVYFGDASDPSFLQLCNIREATAIVITIHTPSAIERLVSVIRQIRPDVPIISRARDALHASKLYGMGVNDAVPETIEASLQLSEAALVGVGVPAGYVIASIHEKRDEFRDALQAAARQAGLQETRAMRRPASGQP